MTEFDARGFAAVFAADPQLDVRPSLASQVARNFHQAPNAFLIDRRERIRIHNIKFSVDREKTARIVPAHSERRLCEIVCAKAEEFSVARNLVGNECGVVFHDRDVVLGGLPWLRARLDEVRGREVRFVRELGERLVSGTP